MISDMHNFIQSRKRKGKTATEIRNDLMEYGYDFHAARGLVMIHWEDDNEKNQESDR